jgi:hypothetical protein
VVSALRCGLLVPLVLVFCWRTSARARVPCFASMVRPICDTFLTIGLLTLMDERITACIPFADGMRASVGLPHLFSGLCMIMAAGATPGLDGH